MSENTKVKKETNKKETCFVMMPISDVDGYPKNHFKKIYEQLFCPAIRKAGYEPYRVDENTICDSIINKIFKAIQESALCLCDLSSRNPNVLYELGLRQAYNKPVVLVQDYRTEKIFDVSGISTVFYRSERLYDEVIEDAEKITDAIIATKEGGDEYNSIVKFVKASTAPIDTGELSQQMRIEILLKGMQSDINQLKRDQDIFNNKELNQKLINNYTKYLIDKMEKSKDVDLDQSNRNKEKYFIKMTNKKDCDIIRYNNVDDEDQE